MRRSVILLSLAGLLLTLPAARAQDSGDTRALSDRLDRLERDMNLLQRPAAPGHPARKRSAASCRAVSRKTRSAP